MSAAQGILMAVAITGGTLLILACVGLPFLIASRNARRLLTEGVSAQAVVESMADTGVTVNGQPVVSFALEVRPEHGAAYRVTHRQSLPCIPMGMVVPGVTLPVRIDPQRPARLRIDWSAWRPAPNGV
ncbi:hypothetical protein HNP84_001056 [Thermocatellispora tengchongensis]|uniref:Uncharacterized protein n=1 Tax=Thermocatellispora tengchongensis TaxID=1073253 RepID=A0A840P1K5_9ACTN|nr:hypothetical protein [Thermocatellispora tengchongensis]MBB5131350.1 hypothetical protein [Thermocatellispora tengchongensis]